MRTVHCLLTLALVIGCTPDLGPPPAKPVAKAPTTPKADATTPQASGGTPAKEPEKALVKTDSKTPGEKTVVEEADPDSDADREVAKAGVGKQGRDYEEGFITTPVKAYFLGKQRIDLEIVLPHAMGLYNAEHGYYPRNMDEFAQMCEAADVRLPELPEGDKYVYNPETHELLVEHHKKRN